MKKSTAIRLLEGQIEKINDRNLKRDEWLNLTIPILSKIFPQSSEIKIKQLKGIQNSPLYFEDISTEEQIAIRKNKAQRYLQNYIEELDLLDLETSGSKLDLFLGSARFWILLLSFGCLSFLIGNSTPSKVFRNFQQYEIQDYQELARSLYNEKKKADSLNKELQKIKTPAIRS